MQQININELKPHPRNSEFFDDMSGEKWEEFLESVRTSGVIEPIVVTTDKVIVSGHQRVRACKELGINSIMCEFKSYKDEDSIIKDLLETNIRQRGDVGGSAKKVGLRIKELERLYGIKQGGSGYYGNQYEESGNKFVTPKTQEDLASEMGIDVRTLQNYKLLSEMIPELEELIDTGVVTKTTALAVMKNLSKQEQEELISSLDTTKRITQSQMQKYIDEIKELKANPPKPSDYESTKRELQDYKKDYSSLRNQFDEKVKELQALRKQMENMKKEEFADPYSKKLTDSTLLFCSKIATFIEQVGGYVWLTDEINKIPELEREGYIKSVHAIKSWADTMEYNINNKVKEII
jgi:ParB-like chromosome segregation protein Spo0J